LEDVWNEVQFLRECCHPNIVAYLGCFIKKGPTKGQKIIWVGISRGMGQNVGVLEAYLCWARVRLSWNTVEVALLKEP
jgi:hypothetical protein